MNKLKPVPIFDQVQVDLNQREAEDLRVRLENAPPYPCDEAFFKRFEMILHDVDFGVFNSTTEEFTVYRLSQPLKRKLSKTGNDSTFTSYLAEIYNLICNERGAKKTARANASQENKNFIEKRAESLKFVQSELNGIRADQNLQEEIKRKPARIFSKEDKDNNIHFQGLPGEDVDRSRKNLIAKKVKINKQITGIEGKIAKIMEKIKPHATKTEEVQALLKEI